MFQGNITNLFDFEQKLKSDDKSSTEFIRKKFKLYTYIYQVVFIAYLSIFNTFLEFLLLKLQ